MDNERKNFRGGLPALIEGEHFQELGYGGETVPTPASTPVSEEPEEQLYRMKFRENVLVPLRCAAHYIIALFP